VNKETRIRIYIMCAAFAAITTGLYLLYIDLNTITFSTSFFGVFSVFYLVMAIGIILKSRFCAIMLIGCQFLFAFKVFPGTRIIDQADLDFTAVYVLFTSFYFLGLIGTISHHKLVKEKRLKEKQAEINDQKDI